MRLLFLLFKSWIEIIQKFKSLQNMGSSWTLTAPSLFPLRIGYFSWKIRALIYSYATPLFIQVFCEPSFRQNTPGKLLKYFFEEQDTALLLLGIGFILFFFFTISVFPWYDARTCSLGCTWCPTLEVWCNVVAYAGSLVQRGGHMHGDSSFRTFFDIIHYDFYKIL